MAAEVRNPTVALIDELYTRPETFDFFQVVRLLELMAARHGARVAVGGDHAPERECVRFRVRPSLAFATTEVLDLRRDGPDALPELTVSFFGFVGGAGTLPQHYTELAIERQLLRDTTLRDFLDLFHHRLLALFHRAWARSRLAFAYEHHLRAGQGGDPFTRALCGLVGHELSSLRGRRTIDDAFLLYASGHFSARRRTALGLRQIIADLCGVPAAVEERVGSWMEIPIEERCTLGARAERACLGRGATLGARAWDVQQTVRLVLGPMTLRTFEHLRPGGAGHGALAGALQAYLGLEWACALRFVLAEEQSRGITLTGRAGDRSARIGANAWIEARTLPEQRRTADFQRGQRSGVRP